MRYKQEPFNQAAFDEAYASFHSPHARPVMVAGPEYMAALLATFAEGEGPFNMSIVAIEQYLAHAAAPEVHLVGVPIWHDHG